MTEPAGPAQPSSGRARFCLEGFYDWPGLLGLALMAVNVAAALVVFTVDLLGGAELVRRGIHA